MNVNYATDPNWFNGISSLMQLIKPYNTSYYSSVAENKASSIVPPSYRREIPVGQPEPSDIKVDFPSGTTATVTIDKLSLRTLPYVSTSTFIKSLPLNTVVTVLGFNSDVSYKPTSTGIYQYHWYRVSANGQTGWVYGKYLNIHNLFQVNATNLHVRTGPAATYPDAAPLLSNNDYVQPVLNSAGAPVNQNGWYQIKVPNSTTTGWVSGDYIRVITK
jgi:uncharacterized protein YgiM (DUF1202 family)